MVGFVEINELKRVGVEHLIQFKWRWEPELGTPRIREGEETFDDSVAAKAFYMLKLEQKATVSVTWQSRVVFATPWKDVFKSENS